MGTYSESFFGFRHCIVRFDKLGDLGHFDERFYLRAQSRDYQFSLNFLGGDICAYHSAEPGGIDEGDAGEIEDN